MLARVRLNLPNLLDDGIQRRRHRLMHQHWVMTLDEIRRPAVAAQQLLQLLARNARQNRRIGDLVTV